MKIDQYYLKKLLIAFEDNEGPQTNIRELKEAGFDYNDQKFIFHMRLLDDQNLIARTDGRPGFGLSLGADDGGSWTVLPLRLTAQGHDFIAALRQKEVWNSVKEGFQEASISTLIDVSKQLAQGFAKQRIKQLTGFDPD
ncbi:DUF2513 domain-containing protein [Pantoea anthophila]|uniref:DUF2513 domain-containing protein n=1 Tax=Pantoea anthophila TaxID=470931 RepID=UPI00301B6D8D